MKKKILLVSQYFWPESFSINDICLELSKKHSIQVLTGKPNYPGGNIFKGYSKNNTVVQNYGKIKIFRVPLVPRKKNSFFNLINNYISFVFNGIYYGRKFKFHEFDHILVYATSPITSVIPAIFLKFKYKKKLTVWVQDLWPESVKNTGYIKNNFLIHLISIIVRYIYRKSDNIIAQSKSFKKNIKKYTNKKIKIVENSHFNLQDKKIDIPKKINYLLKNKYCIVFLGNIGKAQSVKTILSAAKKLYSYKKIHILLIGGGSEVENTRNYIKKNNLKNISIFGPYPSGLALEILKGGKASLLTLKKSKIFSQTIPNKFQTYLFSGKPILVSANGEVAKLTRNNKVGFTSPAEDSIKLVDNAIKLYKLNKKNEKKIKQNSLKFYENSFNINKQVNKLIKIMENV